MNIFDDNCLIRAEYDKVADVVNMEIRGTAGDVFTMLTMIVDQVARHEHISVAELACRIVSASDPMRRLTDKSTVIDLDAIRRAKDKIDGNRA